MTQLRSDLTAKTRDCESALLRKIVGAQPANSVAPQHISLPHDRWLLASALQKTIRLGLAEEAVAAGFAMHDIDSECAWRRLRVIALEDVGLGDIETVAALMAIAGKRAMRRRLGDRQLLLSFVRRLCEAIKDRVACDLLCWIELSPTIVHFRTALLSYPSKWESLAMEGDAPVWQRVVAAQLVSGLTIRTRAGYRSITRANAAAWRRIVEALELPELVAYASVKGASTESLNITLPFAHLLRNDADCAPRTIYEGNPQGLPRIGGLIAPAFCMHTRVGLRALRLLLANDVEIRTQLVRAGATDKVKATGFLLFQIESGRLDCFDDYAPEVRIESERAELAHYGIQDDADAAVLRMMLLRRLPALDDARRTAWTEYQSGVTKQGEQL